MEGRTTLPGLWAAGEVTSSGLHGANRLASNSLLEGLVYGAHAGAGRLARGRRDGRRFSGRAAGQPPVVDGGEPLDLADIRNSLKSLMWRAAGVRRDGERSGRGGRQHRPLVPATCWRGSLPIPAGWELQNMLTVARLMIAAALAREETRGVHLRTDFPARDDAHWQRRIALAAEIFRSWRDPNRRRLRSSGQGYCRRCTF